MGFKLSWISVKGKKSKKELLELVKLRETGRKGEDAIDSPIQFVSKGDRCFLIYNSELSQSATELIGKVSKHFEEALIFEVNENVGVSRLASWKKAGQDWSVAFDADESEKDVVLTQGDLPEQFSSLTENEPMDIPIKFGKLLTGFAYYDNSSPHELSSIENPLVIVGTLTSTEFGKIICESLALDAKLKNSVYLCFDKANRSGLRKWIKPMKKSDNSQESVNLWSEVVSPLAKIQTIGGPWDQKKILALSLAVSKFQTVESARDELSASGFETTLVTELEAEQRRFMRSRRNHRLELKTAQGNLEKEILASRLAKKALAVSDDERSSYLRILDSEIESWDEWDISVAKTVLTQPNGLDDLLKKLTNSSNSPTVGVERFGILQDISKKCGINDLQLFSSLLRQDMYFDFGPSQTYFYMKLLGSSEDIVKALHPALENLSDLLQEYWKIFGLVLIRRQEYGENCRLPSAYMAGGSFRALCAAHSIADSEMTDIITKVLDDPFLYSPGVVGRFIKNHPTISLWLGDLLLDLELRRLKSQTSGYNSTTWIENACRRERNQIRSALKGIFDSNQDILKELKPLCPENLRDLL